MAPPSDSKIALLRLRESDPLAFCAAIRAAFVATGGYWSDAAAQLGVTYWDLKRWVRANESILRGVKMAGPGRPHHKQKLETVTENNTDEKKTTG